MLSSLVAFALLVLVAASTPAVAQTDYNVVIIGGGIVDSTGAAWFYGDVGIRGDTIAPRGARAEAATATRIDADGLIVSPGFIDIQSQSRWAFLFGDGRSKGTRGSWHGSASGLFSRSTGPSPWTTACTRTSKGCWPTPGLESRRQSVPDAAS